MTLLKASSNAATKSNTDIQQLREADEAEALQAAGVEVAPHKEAGKVWLTDHDIKTKTT